MDGCVRSGLECNVERIDSRKKMVKKEQIEFGFIAKEICYGLHLPAFLSIRMTVKI